MHPPRPEVDADAPGHGTGQENPGGEHCMVTGLHVLKKYKLLLFYRDIYVDSNFTHQI